MGNAVYANLMEISCKAANGKSICAMPDVCMTPPQTPATPPGVPIPYPNTGMASDCSDGSSTVMISGQEAMLKNQSYFKKSTGDEAGAAPMKGLISSTNTGKVYFNAWSMDVQIEGANVVRNLDITTHNHASLPGNSPPWPYIDEAAAPGITNACKKDREREEKACGYNKKEGKYTKSASACCRDTECQKARKCMLTPFEGDGSPNCCSPQVAHHILPNSLLQGERGNSESNVAGLIKTGDNAYTLEGAPCVCCSGKKGVSNPIGTHKKMHDLTKEKLRAIMMAGDDLKYEDATQAVSEAHGETFKGDNGKPLCNPDCIKKQIEAHMENTSKGKIKVNQKDGATNKKFEKYKTKKGLG